MDEKGLKKILQIIDVIIKLTNEGKLKTQGLNDRLGVAKEIYQRNICDEEFVDTLNKSINDTNNYHANLCNFRLNR